MKTYNQPTTEIILVENYLCQSASPAEPKVYTPLTPAGEGGTTITTGQSGAM